MSETSEWAEPAVRRQSRGMRGAHTFQGSGFNLRRVRAGESRGSVAGLNDPPKGGQNSRRDQTRWIRRLLHSVGCEQPDSTGSFYRATSISWDASGPIDRGFIAQGDQFTRDFPVDRAIRSTNYIFLLPRREYMKLADLTLGYRLRVGNSLSTHTRATTSWCRISADRQIERSAGQQHRAYEMGPGDSIFKNQYESPDPPIASHGIRLKQGRLRSVRITGLRTIASNAS